jgi:small subunit ribosomal protein S5
MAGIKDVWSRATGKTSTTLNFAMATLEALKKTRRAKMTREVGRV